MRLAVRFECERPAMLPINHQHLLTGLVYRLLGASDADYAEELHDHGYASEEGSGKRFKLFVFSGLRVPKGRRRIVGDRFQIAPGLVEWFLSSPRQDFLLHSATGLLSAGSTVEVGSLRLVIREVCAMPQPTFSPTTAFSCMTPIVASLPLPDRRTYYLRPCEGEAFSQAVRNNLLHKYRLLHAGELPTDDRLTLTFDPAYLDRDPHVGTKKITFKNIDVIGALAPFTLTGSPELIQTAWECGLGEKNSSGFGMIDLNTAPGRGGAAE
ncbi:MAG: CRISPR-associated protein Cas6 [Chthonomonadales bacterium]|nr:CRISPR-associated protein Cas6 [Chthonomonadales bacterium]